MWLTPEVNPTLPHPRSATLLQQTVLCAQFIGSAITLYHTQLISFQDLVVTQWKRSLPSSRPATTRQTVMLMICATPHQDKLDYHVSTKELEPCKSCDVYPNFGKLSSFKKRRLRNFPHFRKLTDYPSYLNYQRILYLYH